MAAPSRSAPVIRFTILPFSRSVCFDCQCTGVCGLEMTGFVGDLVCIWRLDGTVSSLGASSTIIYQDGVALRVVVQGQPTLHALDRLIDSQQPPQFCATRSEDKKKGRRSIVSKPGSGLLSLIGYHTHHHPMPIHPLRLV